MQSNVTNSSNNPVPGAVEKPAPPMRLPLSTLTSQLRTKLRDCQSMPDVASALLAYVGKNLPIHVARVDFREGSKSRSELFAGSSVAPELAQKFSDKFLEPVSIEVQTEPDHSAKARAYKRDDQIISVFAAAIMHEASGLPEGAISIVVLGRLSNPDLMLTQIDALSSVATMRLSELTVSTSAISVQSDPVIATGSPRNEVSAGTKQPTFEALGNVAGQNSPREFAFSIVNTLANQTGAEQVGFGINASDRIRVLAISGLSDFKTASPGVATMQQAMEECLDHGSVIVHQPGQTISDGTQFAIHRRWSAETGGSCLVSLPLRDSQSVVAVVSVRRSGARQFTPQEIAALMQMLQPFGAGLRLLEKANRTLPQQIRAAIQSRTKMLLGPAEVGRKVITGAFVLLSLWIVFGTLTYQPMCSAKVVAENMVQMTSSFEARLLAVHVQPGQEVKAGQLLAEFDTADLKLQLQSLEREISSAEVEIRRAVAARDTSSAALGKARAGVLMTQAAAIQQRLERARLIAPADGIVVRADLDKRVGQSFSQGEPVLQFAPVGGWVLEIQVPDDIGTLVNTKQTGTFAAASYALESMPFEIVSVEGTTQVIDGDNVFIARAPLGERPEWMKSGMEGTAKITTVSKPVWWVALHRVVDWCRLSFWI